MSDFKPLTENLKKFISSLKSKNKRDDAGMFIAEGVHLCTELLKSGFAAELLLLRSNPDEEAISLAEKFFKKNIPVYIARSKQFDGLCETVTPQSVLAVVRSVSQSKISALPFIALDGISDPGNLGTIIRTADWFGFKNIILSSDSADIYNSKTVRSTMGSIFHCNINRCENLSDYIKEHYNTFEIFGASLTGKIKLSSCKPQGKFGIVIGNEVRGISKPVKQILTSEFIIPGSGKVESLNVAVATGISLYHFSDFL